MRFPLIVCKRSAHDKLLADLEKERQARISAQRAAASAGHKMREALADAGKLMEELRLLRIHINRDYNRQSVRFEFELADQTLMEGYRYGDRGEIFRQAVAHHVERAFYMNPETRGLLR